MLGQLARICLNSSQQGKVCEKAYSFLYYRDWNKERPCITGIARASRTRWSIAAREVIQAQTVTHDNEVEHKNQMLRSTATTEIEEVHVTLYGKTLGDETTKRRRERGHSHR